MSTEAAEAAMMALRAGLCVLPPVEDGSKRPDAATWTDYQHRPATEAEVRAWYANGRSGLGIICGAVSGGLELLDFDEREAFEELCDIARATGLGALLERVLAGYMEDTPSGGVHLFYYCDSPRSTKLARRPKRPEEQRDPQDRIKTRIETKGEGGYAVTAPSHGRVHETGGRYELVQGGFETIVRLTDEEREALLDLGRSLDRMPRAEPKPEAPRATGGNGELRPGDDFNARTTWAELLEPRGWVREFVRGSESYWRRPGKPLGVSATTNYEGRNRLKVYSTSTEFETEGTYDLFGAFAVLEHGGDLRAAARALAAKGYGASLRGAAHDPERDEPPPPTDDDAPPIDEMSAAASEGDLLGAGGPEPERPRLSYLDRAPTREQYAALSASPSIVPVVTHLFYPQTTTVLAGQTGIGKTTAGVRATVDLVYGREPWTGRHDGRDPRRVLIVSKDDTTLSIVRKVVALAPDDAWMDGRLTILGKEKRALPLDDEGVEVLGNTIADGRFDVFVIDPYQHFLPAGLTVNDDEGARHTIDKLDTIAESLGVSGVLIHHPRKRGPKAKPAMDMTKGERIEEIRGSAVLAQLARAVATLWEVEPGGRMLDAVVNDVPPLAELFFQTSTYGDQVVKWELAGPPTNAEAEEIRTRLLDLDPGTYNVTALARAAFGIAQGKTPSGPRRTDAKRWARRLAEELPERFAWRGDAGLEVVE